MTALLDAVNNVLAAVALPPVSSLVAPVAGTTLLAQQLVTKENRRAQEEGWQFNTEPRHAFAPDASSEILEPSNLLHFVAELSTRYAFQSGKLRDLANDTTTFTSTVYAKVITLEPFEYTPTYFRSLVEARAARQLHANFRGDPAGARSALADEKKALATARVKDSEAARSNSVQSPSVSRVTSTRRRPRIVG